MHIKRMTIPKTWPLPKKEKIYIVRGKGSHSLKLSLPLLVIFRDILKDVNTRKELKKILLKGEIMVNNEIIKNENFSVGLFDRIYVKKYDKGFSLILDINRQLKIMEISKDKMQKKPFKVIGKRVLDNKKIQVNLYGGWNILTSEKLNIGDSVLISLKDKKIVETLKFAKGSFALVISGKHMGEHGKIESVDNKVTLTIKNKKIMIPKENVFVIEENEITK